MIYNPNNQNEADQARIKLEQFISKKQIFDLIGKREKRSLSANNLYFLWLGYLEDKTGNDKEDLHDFYKNEYIGITTKQILGKMIIIQPTTTDKDSKQFSYYMNKVKGHAFHFFNENLPDPKDQGFEQFYDKYKHILYR